MEESSYARKKDLPIHHIFGTGTPMCAGCGGLGALHELYDIIGDNSVFVNAAGCMTLLSIYPFTPFGGSWLYTAMAAAAAGAQGIRDALDILINKKQITEKDDLEVIVLTGDGSATGIGLSATSGAIDRGLDFIYLCYDNEGYGNTGHQSAATTPLGVKTATSKGAQGYPGTKKDIFAIWTANKPAYAATITWSDPLDLAQKVERARQCTGPKFLLALAPCPTGWGFDPGLSVDIGKLAVQCGIWPLKEYKDGRVVHTRNPRTRKPVEEYLKLQGRYKHLFEPSRNVRVIREIQERIDTYWNNVEELEIQLQ